MSRPAPAAAYLKSPWVCEHLRPFLDWLLERHAALGGVTEVRVLRKTAKPRTWSGYFGPADRDALVEALAPVTEEPRSRLGAGDHPRVGEASFYFSLQAVNPEKVDSARGVLRRSRRTTRDRDVLAYTLFVVDVDPERAAGISATDQEKAAAQEVVDSVRGWLAERGVQALLADSGNGFHLLVPLRPARAEDGEASGKDAHDLLRLLHERFSTEGAKVDTSTFNPSRILKLYGTKAIKGEDTAERPHRYATIDLSSIPEDVDLFAAVAADLAAFRRPPPPPSPTRAPRRPARRSRDGAWPEWRRHALEALPLEAVYGQLLTGKRSGETWLQCRDPASESGDKHPSAGVADGSGEAERGAFHSFRTGETESVFDFLVRWGRAADFRAACALVADWSGVPFPGRPRPSPPSPDIVAELRSRLDEVGADDAQRLDAVRSAIAALLEIPAAEREPLLDQVRSLSGLTVRVFRETVTEVRRAARQALPAPPPPPPPASRAVVEYVVNQDTVAGLFDALVDAVAPAQRFFRTERDLVFVRRGVGPVLVTERNLAGLLSALVEVRFERQTEDGPVFQRYGVLPSELARAFVSDPRVWSRLPELALYCRSPLFDADWRFVGRSGYHPRSRIFYDGPSVSPTDAGAPLLHQALDGFHWKAEADLVNFVGVLLTALTMPHWGRGHPFLAINGNKPGVGKTTLARILGVLVEGTEPSTVSYTPDDAEFEKQLATRVDAGDRIIVVDNAKTNRGIESPVLERSITDSRLNFRRLGSNSAITRPQNDILFCLTMNLTTLGPDLRRRALPVNLLLDRDVQRTTYPMADVVGFVHQHRLEIVAELAGMVQAWLDCGRPACGEPAKHSTSQLWAATMDAVLRLSAFDGFLTNFEESTHAFDPRYELMLDVVRAHREAAAAPASEWVGRLEELLADRFKDRRGNPKSARSKSTIVGHLFREYVDTRFTVDGSVWRLARTYPEGEGQKPAYGFEEVAS